MRKIDFIPGALSIRAHLVALVAVVLFPLLCLAVFLGIRYANAQRQVIEARRFDTVNNLIFAVDKEIEGNMALLRSLAASADVQTGKIDAFWSYARAAASTRNVDAIILTDKTGQRVASTLVPPGQPLPKWYDMAPLDGVFDGKEVVSGLTIGGISRKPVFLVTVPVRVDNKVTYALSAGILLDRLNGLFAEANLKPEWFGCIVDRQGRFLARSRNSTANLGKFAHRELTALAGLEAGTFDNVTREGVPVANSFRRSMTSGWTAFVAVPKEILDEPLHWIFMMLIASTAVAVLFAIGLASFLARRISEPIRGLRRSALALIDGQPAVLWQSSVAELDEVAKAFDYAGSVASERRKLAEQLLISEERLTQAVAVAALGIFHHDHISDELEFSPALREMFGFTPYEAIRMDTWLSRVFEEDRAPLIERVKRSHHPSGDGSYICEHRIVHPASGIRWLDVRAQTFFEGKGAARRPIQTIGAVREVTERKRVEEHLCFVMRELSHRSKNLLAVIQAMAKQTARSAVSFEDFQSRFADRLQALAASHDLLTSQNWAGAPLEMLVRRHFELFDEIEESHLQLSGPDVAVAPGAAQAIGLALHELATNSIKYGALSQPAGKVTITWGFEPEDGSAAGLRLNWQESGGPAVKPPVRKGFGHVVIEEMVAHALDGKVAIDFAPSGLRWTLSLCTRHIAQEPQLASDNAAALMEQPQPA